MTKKVWGCCFSCGIGIGEGYIEPELYSLGEHEICLWCKMELRKRGVLKIRAEEDRMGIEHRVVYLYQDGRVEGIKDGYTSCSLWNSQLHS